MRAGRSRGPDGAIVERAQKMEPHHVCRTRPVGTVLDIRGEPLPGGGLVTIWTDITALKQAEREALERAQELRLVTDNVPGVIAFIDTEMRNRFVNRQLAMLLGHEDGRRIVGRTVREVVGDDV
jgi:PAS domain-containing protein